jgi:hypothetical protein
MGMRAEEPRAFDTDRAVAKCSALGGAGDDAAASIQAAVERGKRVQGPAEAD